jgi:hypothetical protein
MWKRLLGAYANTLQITHLYRHRVPAGLTRSVSHPPRQAAQRRTQRPRKGFVDFDSEYHLYQIGGTLKE